jgi:alpha-tubulin suppressor-like RCC1 family protein
VRNTRVLAYCFVWLASFVTVPAWAQTVAAGSAHSVVLKSDGTVWTFGLNSDGQLGDDSWTGRKTPVQVSV